MNLLFRIALALLASTVSLAAYADEPSVLISYIYPAEVKTGRAPIPFPILSWKGDGQIIYDVIRVTEDGSKIYLNAVNEGKFQYWIELLKPTKEKLSGFIYVPDDLTVVRSCYTHFRLCSDLKNPFSCHHLNEFLFYEVDMNSGAAATNIPMVEGVSLPAGSEKFEAKLCDPDVS